MTIVRSVSAIRVVVALAAFVMLAVTGCSTDTRQTSDAPATGGVTGSLVMVIRHGEKPAGSTPGIDAQGNPDSSSLTETGWNRARRLVDLFDPADGHLRAGLARPRQGGVARP